MAYKGLKGLIFLSFTMAIGILLIILACTEFGKIFWPMLVFLTYFIAPLPTFIAARCSQDSFSVSARSPCMEIALFLTGAIVVSGFGIPLVLGHAGKIQVGAMVLTLLGNCLVFATIVLYVKFYGKQEDDW